MRQSSIVTLKRWLIRRGECWYEAAGDHSGADVVHYLHLPSPLVNSRITPFKTIAIDLEKPEDLLLREMNKTTRNELRRAALEGLKYECWHANASEAVEPFGRFFSANEVQGSGGQKELQWVRSHASWGTLDVSRIAQSEGKVLAWHVYYRDASHARLKYSVSLSREQHAQDRAMIGRANRLQHWLDICRFKAEGLKTYDLGGWYAGIDDEKLLRVNRFKEGLGGEIISSFHCTIGVTMRGRIFLWALDLRDRIKERSKGRLACRQ